MVERYLREQLSNHLNQSMQARTIRVEPGTGVAQLSLLTGLTGSVSDAFTAVLTVEPTVPIFSEILGDSGQLLATASHSFGIAGGTLSDGLRTPDYSYLSEIADLQAQVGTLTEQLTEASLQLDIASAALGPALTELLSVHLPGVILRRPRLRIDRSLR